MEGKWQAMCHFGNDSAWVKETSVFELVLSSRFVFRTNRSFNLRQYRLFTDKFRGKWPVLRWIPWIRLLIRQIHHPGDRVPGISGVQCPRRRVFMNRHTILMIIGCVLPLLLIFLAPLFGLDGRVSLLVFVVAMFLCHLLMPMHGRGHASHEKNSANEGEVRS